MSAVRAQQAGSETEFRVLIAGGGVAALEAVLALREHHRGELAVELVCPEAEFTLRPLAVTQPFGGDLPPRLDLGEFCDEHDVTLRCDRIAEVWGDQQRALLDSGEDVFYDALLLALGATPYSALPGADLFRGAVDAPRFGELLEKLSRGSAKRVAFAVPVEVRWSLPLYEIALLTAHHLREAGITGVELAFVTHETEPLGVFGKAGSGRVAELLAEMEIELFTDSQPERFDGEQLLLAGGGRIETGHVVALPGLRVPSITGLPQGRRGFIGTDPEMRVEGLSRVWAAGDASWLPIKQGGLAAQQADVAAASIASAAGLEVEVPVFRPILRGALLTGGEPEFIRAEVGGKGAADFASTPLWWPPRKVAGARLAPYLDRMLTGAPGDPLSAFEDLEGPTADRRTEAEREHREALELSLTSADHDAREGDLEQALRWLDVAERLNVRLPSEYVERRQSWRNQLAENS